MKSVIIIGAGVAGLTCGIYAGINGFETTIYEAHSIPGGECTGWDRKDYHFDGCIHWLMGSKKGTALHELWRNTGALDDSVNVINHDIFSRYEEEDIAVNFYTDADRLEKHLLEIAPEDKKAVKSFCNAIRKTGGFGMPLEKPMDMMTLGDGLKYAANNMAGFIIMNRYNKMAMKEFASLFKNPVLRRAMYSSIPDCYSAMALIATLAGMNAGDRGYPIGGSRALAKRMEKKFLDKGGKINFNAKVEKILVENGSAVGIRLADGKEAFADHIVSCADAYNTFMHMLENKYTPEMYTTLFENPGRFPTITCVLVFMGVNADIPYTCRAIQVRRRTPAKISGVTNDCIQLLHFGYDSNMAPIGKTVMAGYYYADYDYWNALYRDKEKYNAEKKILEEDAIAALVARYPEAEGKIEVTDVVTPMTYERFCNAWRGSWMTWAKNGKGVPQYYPGILPGLENFILAGMWTLPPGGLPGAAAAGRFAAHRLCIQNGLVFKADTEKTIEAELCSGKLINLEDVK